MRLDNFVAKVKKKSLSSGNINKDVTPASGKDMYVVFTVKRSALTIKRLPSKTKKILLTMKKPHRTAK
jgi:hypothetical protein